MANLTKLGDLWLAAESTFSTEPSATGSGYEKTLAEDVSVTYSHPPIERNAIRDGLGKSLSSVAGQKGGTLSFKTPLHGLATAGASGVAAVMDPWLQTLFEACGYVVVEGTGTVVTGAGSTTTVIDVTSAAGIQPGTMVLIGGEAVLVTAVDTGATPDNITVTPALSAIPAASTVVYSSGSVALTSSAAYEPTSCAFVWAHDGNQVTLLGCAGTVKIENFDAGTRPMLSWEFQINTFDTTTKASLPTTAATQRTNLLARRSTGDTVGSRLVWGSTATALATARTAFDPGLVLSPKPSINGIEGRIGWVITAEEAKLEVLPYSAQTTYWSDYQTPTLRTALVQVGKAHTAAFAVAMQQAQVMDLPSEEDIGGIRGSGLTLRLREPTVADLPTFVMAMF